MHEFAIVEELVKTVLEELGRLASPHTLRSARVVVGAMRRIMPESLRLSYEVQTRDTAAAGSALEITVVPATALCRDCGRQGEVPDIPYLCQVCGSANLHMLNGMEFYLAGLEVDDAEAEGQ